MSTSLPSYFPALSDLKTISSMPTFCCWLEQETSMSLQSLIESKPDVWLRELARCLVEHASMVDFLSDHWHSHSLPPYE